MFVVEPHEREASTAIEDDFEAEAAMVDFFIRSSMYSVGVLCLTRSPSNEVMWGNYADNHRGFVLGLDRSVGPFDGSAQFWPTPFFPEDLTGMRGFGSFRDVTYQDNPLVIKFGGSVPFDAFFTKRLRWSYEEEVRIFRSLSEATRVVRASPADIHLFTIPATAILEVIVGAQASEEVATTARELRNSSRLPRAKFLRARVNTRKQAIGFIPLD
jgi:hypothetical protein